MKYKILSTLFLAFSLHSNSEAACLDSYKVMNKAQMQTGSLNSETCFISIGAFDEINLIYRNYLFVSDSSFMVFNSFGPGPDSTHTGAREFMFFPQTQVLTYVEKPQSVEILLSQLNFSYDTSTNKITAIDGIKFKEASKVDPHNNGGFDILSSQSLYLDLGFKLGGSPRVEQNRKVSFHDRQNFVCEVSNSEIFDYSKDVYNPMFRFPSNEGLSNFLKIRCSHLIK